MSVHHFNVEDAIEHGVEKAILLYNLRFWLEKNKANDNASHKHDGHYWTYNSAKAFSQLFPYLNRLKIQRLLKVMEADGLILSGNYNKVSYDRTKWYSMPEFKLEQSIVQHGSIHCSNMNNGLIRNDQPIPYITTDSKPYIKHMRLDGDNVDCSGDIQNKKVAAKNTSSQFDFESWWNSYDYKKSKLKALAKWNSLTEEQKEIAMDVVDAYVASTPDKTYRKHPTTYLNSEGWNDEVTIPRSNKILTTTNLKGLPNGQYQLSNQSSGEQVKQSLRAQFARPARDIRTAH